MPQIIDGNGFVIVVLGVLCLGLIVLLFIIARKKAVDSATAERLALEKVSQKSFEILEAATKRAQEIIGKASLEEIDIASAFKDKSNQIQKEFEMKFESQLQSINGNLATVDQQYEKFLAALREKVIQIESNNEQLIKSHINTIFEGFEQNLSQFLNDTEQRSVNSIQLELQSTRQLIDTYRQQQLALIDENIIAMLERTLSLVLAKKLSLNDQTDLVYESLEKAKVEKFIV